MKVLRAICQCPCGCKMQILCKLSRQPKAFCFFCTANEWHQGKYLAPGFVNKQEGEVVDVDTLSL